jgi:hypothetical protein
MVNKKMITSNQIMVDDPMWFTRQVPLNEDIKIGYCQAVYQIRMKMGSMDKEPPEIRKYTEFMIEELNKINY